MICNATRAAHTLHSDQYGSKLLSQIQSHLSSILKIQQLYFLNEVVLNRFDPDLLTANKLISQERQGTHLYFPNSNISGSFRGAEILFDIVIQIKLKII